MGESSSEELSRELSNLSFTSNANGAISSSTTESRKGKGNVRPDAEAVSSSYTDEYVDENSDDEKGKNISRGSTEVSIPGKHSNSDTEATDVWKENSSVVINESSQDNVIIGADDSKVGSDGSSREGSSLPEKQQLSRENTSASENEGLLQENSFVSVNEHLSRENTSASEKEHVSRESSTASEKRSLSRESMSSSSGQLSRETTEMSEQDDSSQENNMASHENTMSTNSEMYQDDFEAASRENTMLTNNETYGDDFNDSSDSQEQTFNDNQDNEELDELEKEKSVLIERDGKFELVNPSELEAEEMEMLGLPSIVEPKEKTSTKSIQRPQSNTNKNPEYSHVTSAYALTETQREMKKRRISVRHMRMNEEKQRLLEEEEKQRIANKKSYRKWMLQKSATTHQPSKKEIAEATANEERRKIAEKSYNLWLKEKEQQQKEERKLEKIRLADEAEHYVVRDRVMCERSFRQWLKQKKQEEDNSKMPILEKSRKKSATKPKQKPMTYEQKPRSAVYKPKHQGVTKEQRQQSLSKLNKRMSKVRYAETFGYRHPASIDDLITYKI